jgi:type II secretory pathway pseudopilin PulG
MQRLRRNSSSPSFTLIELLVVIGIIVVVVLMTLPVLNVLQGNRSADAAQNQIQAVLSEARMNAIGLQRDAGVMFYIDQSTHRINMILVQATDSLTGDPDVEDFLDIIRDHESVQLTLGLSLQLMDNASVVPGTPGTPGTRGDDGYIGFNTDNAGNPNTIAYGGVILFDSHGQLVSRKYGFRTVAFDDKGKPIYSEMGNLLVLNKTGPAPAANFYVPGGGGINPPPPQSAFGLVVFNAEAFKGNDFSEGDSQVAGCGFLNKKGAALSGYAGPESTEEDWIDKNSVPLIINRYNGTLIRGE